MTNDADKNKQAAGEETQANQTNGKSPLMKYLLFGVGGLVLVVGIAFGVLLLLGGDNAPAGADAESSTDGEHAMAESASPATPSQSTTSQPQDNPHAAGEPSSDDLLDSLLHTGDEAFLDQIMDNLAHLEDVPDESEIEAEALEQSRQDSLSKVDWLQKEKAKLAERTAEVDRRERELAKLDQEVTQKLLKVEQIETNRINNLAKLYDGMDARAVAQLMANLDDGTVVALLPRMKTKNASAVMSLLPAKRAAKLSKQMITIASN